MNALPRCAVVIPTFNGAHLLTTCLESLLAHPPERCEMEVVLSTTRPPTARSSASPTTSLGCGSSSTSRTAGSRSPATTAPPRPVTSTTSSSQQRHGPAARLAGRSGRRGGSRPGCRRGRLEAPLSRWHRPARWGDDRPGRWRATSTRASRAIIRRSNAHARSLPPPPPACWSAASPSRRSVASTPPTSTLRGHRPLPATSRTSVVRRCATARAASLPPRVGDPLVSCADGGRRAQQPPLRRSLARSDRARRFRPLTSRTA